MLKALFFWLSKCQLGTGPLGYFSFSRGISLVPMVMIVLPSALSWDRKGDIAICKALIDESF